MEMTRSDSMKHLLSSSRCCAKDHPISSSYENNSSPSELYCLVEQSFLTFIVEGRSERTITANIYNAKRVSRGTVTIDLFLLFLLPIQRNFHLFLFA